MRLVDVTRTRELLEPGSKRLVRPRRIVYVRVMGRTRLRVGPETVRAAREEPATDVPSRRWLVRVLDMGISVPTRRTRSDGSGHGAWPEDATRRERPPIEPPSPPRTRPSGADFDDFYRSNYPTVTRLAYSLCGSLTVAEELAQEAFVAAHRRWRRVADFDRPDLWVRRVVINRSISFRRKQASERRALKRISSRPSATAEPVLADEEVWRALRSLSRRQCEVLALVYVEDRPIAEVAAVLRLGEETVRTHLKRGRAALAERLRRDAEERSDVSEVAG